MHDDFKEFLMDCDISEALVSKTGSPVGGWKSRLSKSAAAKAEERNADKEAAKERYAQKQAEYEKKREDVSKYKERGYRNIPRSIGTGIGSGIEKLGQKISDINVLDAEGLGRKAAETTMNLPTKALGTTVGLIGKGIKAGTKYATGTPLLRPSKKTYEKELEQKRAEAAKADIERDVAAKRAEHRLRVPDPTKKVDKEQLTKQAQEKAQDQEAKQKMGGEKFNAAQSILDQMKKEREQEQQDLQKRGETGKQQKLQQQAKISSMSGQQLTDKLKQEREQQTPSLQQRKERSYGSKSYAGDPYGAEAASRIRSGRKFMDPDISFDRPESRLGKPTLPVKSQTTTPQTKPTTPQPQVQQQPQTQQQPQQSLSDRRKFSTNIKPNQLYQSTLAGGGKPVSRPKPQPQQTQQPVQSKPTQQTGSKPEAFARPNKPNNKPLQTRRQPDPTGFGDD